MRRVLIVTGGMSPAIVTETIWALWRQHKPAFWPEKVLVVVTAKAREGYEQHLLGPQGKLAQLSKELKRPSLHDATRIVATECPDIRSDADAIAFGDKVCEVVQDETADDQAIVHLSLAGGRKTMSFHGGAAMTLFGRLTDELSHVLVHPPELESPKADFWWPGHRLQGDVELSIIPFVRVRDRLPAAMLKERMDYKRYVALVNAAIAGTDPVVELLADTSTLKIAGGAVTIRLEPTDFKVYRVIAEWAKAAVPSVGPAGAGGNHGGWLTPEMIQLPQNYEPNPIARLNRLGGSRKTFKSDTSGSADPKAANNAFGQAVARVRARIEEHVLDKTLAARLLGRQAAGDGEPARFGLMLSPHEIIIRAREDGPEIPPFS